jgi:hypothetical protein
VPLRVSKDGRTLEAQLASSLPARVTLHLSFTPGGPEQRFDFAFPAYTEEPKPGRGPATTAKVSTATPPSGKPSASAAAASDALLEELVKDKKAVDAAVSDGAYGAIYIPALAAKDAALQLESLGASFPESQRALISAAVKRVVVAAWLLDAYGDLGDRLRIEDAHRAFALGVDELVAGYAK